MSKAVVRLRRISKAFGRLAILSDVDLTLSESCLMRLSGRNGSGKSTLLRIVAGDLAPDRGTVEVDGAVRRALTIAEAAGLGIAVVYQDLGLCDHLSVLENMFLGREIRLQHAGRVPLGLPDHNAMQAVAGAMIRRLGVRLDVEGRDLVGLSGGQRQAIALCRALVQRSRVLLLDEPTAALDVATRDRFYAMIEERRSMGTAVMLISHEDSRLSFPSEQHIDLDGGHLRELSMEVR